MAPTLSSNRPAHASSPPTACRTVATLSIPATSSRARSENSRRQSPEPNMSKPYLILNAGSSSLRFALFEPRGGTELLPTLRGNIEGIPGEARFAATHNAGENFVFEHRWSDGAIINHEAAA